MEDEGIRTVTRKRKIRTEDGGEISCAITLPESDRWKGISKFYGEIGERCLRYCESGLALSLKGEAHSYRYRLSSEVKEKGSLVRVLIKVRLIDRNEARVIDGREMTHIWKYGMLVGARRRRV